MSATGLQIVWTEACWPWCSISSSFQNSLKTSGHRGYECLEFWCWNLVPFLPEIGFQLLKNSWLFLTYFSLNDASNVLYRWKIWTAGWPIRQLHDAPAKQKVSWRTPPTPPTVSSSSYPQVDGTGVSEPAPSDCSTAFSPRLWEPWTHITPPLSETPNTPPPPHLTTSQEKNC